MNFTEDQLATWAKPPSETEETKCSNTVSRVTRALRAKFGNEVSIFLQGSYKNRTNVRRDSDVDIVVCHNNYYFPDVAFLSDSEKTTFWQNFTASQYSFAQFKNDAVAALQSEFSFGDVQRKNKCVLIEEGSQRVNADVVPCFEHRRYAGPYNVSNTGIEFETDNGSRIYSFPEQHYNNGVAKNERTGRMYKSVVRIMKHARNQMVDAGLIGSDAMSSFFLESLVWNVDDDCFNQRTYAEGTRKVISRIWNDMGNAEKANNYAEVSDLKWLFRGNTSKTPQQGRDFMFKLWNFLGYE